MGPHEMIEQLFPAVKRFRIFAMLRDIQSGKITKPDALRKKLSLAFSANIITAGLGTITGLLVARILGPQGRGELAAIQVWALSLGSLSTIGMEESVVYFVSRYPNWAGNYLATAHLVELAPAIVFSALGWILMPILLSAQSVEVVEAARLYLLLMISLYSTFIYYEILRPLGAWLSWSFLRVLPPLVWILILIVAAYVPSWCNSVFLSRIYPTIFLFQIVPAVLIARRFVSSSFSLDLTLTRPLFHYGVPTVLATLPKALKLDQLVIASFLSPQLLGLYVAAMAWGSVSSPVFVSVGQVLFPQLSSVVGVEQQRALLNRVYKMGFYIDVILTLFLLLLTPSIFPLLFGDEFRGAIMPALVLVLANGFSNINMTLANALRGLGRPREVLVAQFIGLGITALLLLFLLPKFGIIGAAVSSLMAYVAVSICLSLFAKEAAR